MDPNRRISTLAVLLLALAAAANATVVGVDLGSQFMKMSVVRPGGSGIELVTNEQAKRKTPTAIAFTTDDERLFGDAAIAYAGKKPMRVLLRTREILGKCVDDAHLTAPADCERLTVSLANDGNSEAAKSPHFVFTGEEITSMFITLARQLTAAHIESVTSKKTSPASLTDVVVTVPSWFAETERLAVIDSAILAGMNPLATINVNTAAALKYTLDSRGDAEKIRNETFIMIDVGSTGTTASVGRVERGASPKDKVKLIMMAHAWDSTLGGAALDEILAMRLAEIFDEKRAVAKGQPKSTEIPPVMNRLRREATRLREVLSANTQAFVSVEALHNDIDFSTQITRKEFESLSASVFNRVPAPIKEAITKAGMKLDQINTVIPYGGASRIPRVLELIQKTTERETLNKSINADEAAVMGAAFYGATLSSRFQVRKIDVFDVLPHKVSSEIGREASAKKQAQASDIFAKEARIPSKKLMTVRRADDFDVSIFMEGDGWLKKSIIPIGTFEVKGVASVFEQLKNTTKEEAGNPKVGLTFEVDRSGLVNIQKAEVTLDEVTVIEREVPIKKPKKDEKKQDGEAETTDAKSDAENEKESPDASPSPSESPKTKIEKSQKTVVHRIYPTITLKEGGKGLRSFQMTKESREKSRKLLKQYDDAEQERKRKADLLNSLEGFVLEIRGQLSDDVYDEVTSEEERENIAEIFMEADDWLYTDEARVTENLLSKQKSLNELMDPVLLRYREKSRRPQVIASFEAATAYLLNATETLLAHHIEANSTHIEKMDNHIVAITEAQSWMSDLISQQNAKTLLEAPAFTSADVEAKIAELTNQLRKLGNIPLPKKPSPTPSPTESNSPDSSSAPIDEEIESPKEEADVENPNSSGPGSGDQSSSANDEEADEKEEL